MAYWKHIFKNFSLYHYKDSLLNYLGVTLIKINYFIFVLIRRQMTLSAWIGETVPSSVLYGKNLFFSPLNLIRYRLKMSLEIDFSNPKYYR